MRLNVSVLLWLLMFLFSALPFRAYAQPTEVVGTCGSDFVLDDQAFRFIGVNIRGLCHYGENDILIYTQESHIGENLDAVANMGGKVVRVFGPVKFATHSENVNRIEAVLDAMESRGLKAIISLIDVYNTGFHPQGDDSYYMSQPGGYTLLDDAWFAGGYQDNYLPFVQMVTSQLKNHNAIFAWELGNELTDIKNPSNIITFARNVAAVIKANDPYHMVTTGFISIDHTQIGETAGINLYSDPNIDFMTTHSYNGEDHLVNHAVHSKLGIPNILEEYGWSEGNGDRVANTSAQLTRWLDQRALRGFMQWGFQAQSYDIGDGDNIVGMDQYAQSDYSQLFSLYQGWASTLASQTSLPSRLSPLGTNVALSSTGWQADSTFSSSYEGDLVYDGVVAPASKWTSNGAAPPHWVAIDLGAQRNVNDFVVRMSGTAGENFDYAFKAFQIQSGSSLTGPWTTVATVDNSPQFSDVHVIVDPPETMRYVRLYITDTGVDNYARLPEFEVYEEVSGVSHWDVY